MGMGKLSFPQSEATSSALTERTLSYLERTRLDSDTVSRYLGDAALAEPKAGKSDPGGSADAASPKPKVPEYGTPFSRVMAGVFGGETTAAPNRQAALHASPLPDEMAVEMAATSVRVERMLQAVLANQTKLMNRMQEQQSEHDSFGSFMRRQSNAHDASMQQISQDVSSLRDWVVGDAVAKLHNA